jgi:hypothetical protein
MAAQFTARNGCVGAVAVVVDGAGGEFLAGAAFAGDERGGVRGGNLSQTSLNTCCIGPLRPMMPSS